jgi:hypothetical protein
MPDPCAHVAFGFMAARIVDVLVPWSRDNGSSSVATARASFMVVDALVAVGSLLPDLLDKPLYLCRCAPGTRSYGHTLLFLIAATGATAAALLHSPASLAAALPLGAAALVAQWQNAARVVFVAIASHLLADTFFGYVPLLWPLPGWGFRAASIMPREERDKARRRRRMLDVAGVAYVTLATAVPQHVGGWTRFAAVLLLAVVGFAAAKQIVAQKRWPWAASNVRRHDAAPATNAAASGGRRSSEPACITEGDCGSDARRDGACGAVSSSAGSAGGCMSAGGPPIPPIRGVSATRAETS